MVQVAGSQTVRRTIPLYIASALCGALLIEYFVNVPPLTFAKDELVRWVNIIFVFTSILATLVLLNTYQANFRRSLSSKRYDFQLVKCLVFFGSYAVFAVIGFTYGTASAQFNFLIQRVTNGIGHGFSLVLTTFEVWAAYLAFRVKNTDSLIIFLAGTISILGAAPLGSFIPGVDAITLWVLQVPSVAAMRGGIIALNIGALLLAYRVIVGKETGIID